MILEAIAPGPDFLEQEAAREWLARHGADRLLADGAEVQAAALVEHGTRLDVRLLAGGRVVTGPVLTHACTCGKPLPRHRRQCLWCEHGTAFCRACGVEILGKYRYCVGCSHAVAAPFCPPRGLKPAPWHPPCPYEGCGIPAGSGQMMCAEHWKALPQVFKARFVSLMARDFRGSMWEEEVAELVELACHAVSEQLMLSYQEKS